MCTAGQEVTHQRPCSGAGAGPGTQRGNMKQEFWNEKKRVKMKQMQLQVLMGEKKTGTARLHHGAADTEPEGQVHPGASASFGASRNSASPSWMVKIHHTPVSLHTHWRAKGLGARNLCPGHTWARQQDFPEHPDAGASRVFALSGCSGKGHGTPRALKTQGGANKRKSFFPGTAEQARGEKKNRRLKQADKENVTFSHILCAW